ncbi:hypothetical protein [Maridesulfovibrio zosterae]|uniref:hypothetical protein n=1 Tax=Maridesulfovibrio zosterae TaxID=82171 RepID=UPI00040B3216|nr:hypothetical protein [Maridesulfovibrio zosterae]
MNALAKLQSKYKKAEPETPYRKFSRLCKLEGVNPISEGEFNQQWQECESGHEAMKTLGRMIREQGQRFMVKRNKADELVVVIDEVWAKANGETLWQMWELYEKAAPLIGLCYLNNLLIHGDEPPKRFIEGRLPLGIPQRSINHG